VGRTAQVGHAGLGQRLDDLVVLAAVVLGPLGPGPDQRHQVLGPLEQLIRCDGV
jgi:hypothetical protein